MLSRAAQSPKSLNACSARFSAAPVSELGGWLILQAWKLSTPCWIRSARSLYCPAPAATPAVTTQALAADAAFLAYAPAPSDGAGALCLVDTGVDVNPDTQAELISATAVDSGTSNDVDPDAHGKTMAMIATYTSNLAVRSRSGDILRDAKRAANSMLDVSVCLNVVHETRHPCRPMSGRDVAHELQIGDNHHLARHEL